ILGPWWRAGVVGVVGILGFLDTMIPRAFPQIATEWQRPTFAPGSWLALFGLLLVVLGIHGAVQAVERRDAEILSLHKGANSRLVAARTLLRKCDEQTHLCVEDWRGNRTIPLAAALRWRDEANRLVEEYLGGEALRELDDLN